MRHHRLLMSPIGSLVTTVAMFDDVICLVMLAIITQVFARTIEGWQIARPIVASICTIVVGLGMAFVMPKAYAIIRPLVVTKSEKVWRELFLSFMFLYGTAFSFLSELAGSTRLLGVFLAGISLAGIPEACELWEKKVGAIQRWLTSIFFASIGFIIPIKSLFEAKIVGYGLAYSVISTFAKFVACFVPNIDGKIAIGFAMVARGEVGLVLVKQAFDEGILGLEALAVTCWAVVLCSVIGAVGSSYIIKKMSHNNAEEVVVLDVQEDINAKDSDNGHNCKINASSGTDATTIHSPKVSNDEQLHDIKEGEDKERVVIEVKDDKYKGTEILREQIPSVDSRVHVEVNDESIT